jgi:hypothetical protein
MAQMVCAGRQKSQNRGMIRLVLVLCSCLAVAAENSRPPKSEAELRGWLENMVWWHGFSVGEVAEATGLTVEKARGELKRLDISEGNRPKREGTGLLVLPYPGGRHPRIGFLDGAIDPQRETKLSIFAPWDERGYVVADVPEAIWSNLGLTYLAHKHIPTIWGETALPKLEWEKLGEGAYRMERTLPNGISFGTAARATNQMVVVKMWLSNGTERALSDLRVQNCIMLKGLPGFNEQTNENKLLRGNLAACRNGAGRRWVISGFSPIGRVWANPPVPCLHADPKFPETAPGGRSEINGLIALYEGTEIEAKLAELESELAKLR